MAGEEGVRAEIDAAGALRAHRRLLQVLDDVDDIVVVTHIERGVVYANRSAVAHFGPMSAGTSIRSLIDRDLRDFAAREVEPVIGRMQRWTGDIDMHDIAGRHHVMATSVSPVAEPSSEEVYFGIIMRDVTRERSHARALAEQARRDHLTGLPNRLALMEHLDSCARYGVEDGSVTLCFIDLDNLKVVNDGLGHSAGDRLLVAVAERLRDAVGDDLVARFGGDEFVVLSEHLTPTDAISEAERLLTAIGGVDVSGVSTHLSASIGVASSSRHDLDPERIIRDADAAMYEAKRQGRGCCVLFDDTMREHVTRRFVVETSLRQAMADGLIEVHLQPIVSVPNGRVDGFEALARWGLVEPIEFVTTAEESGLIVPLGQWVLNESLRALSEIQRANPQATDLKLSVNVSGRQLLDPAFAERTLDAIHGSGIDPHSIILELTESVLIDPRDEVDRTLRRLRDAGVSLALDDFGSGYSSLGYLRRYPIEILKLDNSYTQALLTDTDTRIITEAVVTMAKRLGLQVVAEGVETLAQLEIVTDMGISQAQGFLISPALTTEAISQQGIAGLEAGLADLRKALQVKATS